MTEQQPRVKPSLQALLVCDRVETSPDGTHTLHRVIDRWHIGMEIEIEEPPLEVAKPPEVSVPLEFTIYTRWGAGVGHFRQHVALTNPSGETVEFGEKDFWLPNKAASQAMLGRARIGVSEPGHYTLSAFLDNEKVGEYVIVVELTTRIRQRHPPE